jgi:hypothetical protein
MIPQDFPSCYYSSMRNLAVLFILFFAKTPRQLSFTHVTCYTAALYVVDSKCAPNFGEAQGGQVDRPTAQESLA